MTQSIGVAVITISDRSASGQRADLTGPALVELIDGHNWQVVLSRIISDDILTIEQTLRECVSFKADLILTAGGTGFSPRDNTPEATMRVLDRLAPGITEFMRSASFTRTPHAMLSRAIAGISGSSLIINLPGSPKAAVENLQSIIKVIPHAIELIQNDPSAENHHNKI